MTTIAQFVCPCCERPLDNQLPVTALKDIPCSRSRGRVLDALIRAYPRPVAMDVLIDAAYGDDPDGGPLNAAGGVRNLVYGLRNKMAEYGWQIPVGNPHVRQYHLEPLGHEMRPRRAGHYGKTPMFNQTRKGASTTAHKKPSERHRDRSSGPSHDAEAQSSDERLRC